MADSSNSLKVAKLLYGQALNLFCQMEVLDALHQSEKHEHFYYVGSHSGEFYLGIRNALNTAIIVDFQRIVSDKTHGVASLLKQVMPTKVNKVTQIEPCSLGKPKFSELLSEWTSTYAKLIGKISAYRNNRAAHNNIDTNDTWKPAEPLSWSELRQCINELREVLVSFINLHETTDLGLVGSNFGTDASRQTTAVMCQLMEEPRRRYEQQLK